MKTCALIGVGLLLVACSNGAATAADCRFLLDRIVAIELSERGFRDPALLARKQEGLARRFRRELELCEGRALRSDARACAIVAKTQEDLSHQCLR